MLHQQGDREIAWRPALICVLSYIGGVGGLVYSNSGRLELSMFNPMATLSLLVGSMITPVANVVLIGTLVWCATYMVTRVPRWMCVVCGVLMGIIVATVRAKWRSG